MYNTSCPEADHRRLRPDLLESQPHPHVPSKVVDPPLAVRHCDRAFAVGRNREPFAVTVGSPALAQPPAAIPTTICPPFAEPVQVDERAPLGIRKAKPTESVSGKRISGSRHGFDRKGRANSQARFISVVPWRM